MIPLYRWNGTYFGFIKNNRIFNASSEYLGWISKDGRAWRTDGSFLGEIEKDNYILRRTAMATPGARPRKARPVKPAGPVRRANRPRKAKRAGKIDALEEFTGA